MKSINNTNRSYVTRNFSDFDVSLCSLNTNRCVPLAMSRINLANTARNPKSSTTAEQTHLTS